MVMALLLRGLPPDLAFGWPITFKIEDFYSRFLERRRQLGRKEEIGAPFKTAAEPEGRSRQRKDSPGF